MYQRRREFYRQTDARRQACLVEGSTDFMAEKPSTANPTAYQALVNDLRASATVTDLFKLASSDLFRAAAAALPPEEVKALREEYRSCQTALDGKVKLEQFDGQVLNLTGVEWWHSETFDNDGVTLRFWPEHDSAHSFKALTSSAPIVRFCNRFGAEGALPTPQKPARVIVQLQPVKDAERARQGQKIWTIKALPTPTATPGGSPF